MPKHYNIGEKFMSKILIGTHCLKDANYNCYYQVAVFLSLVEGRTVRETCLLREQKYEDLMEGLQYTDNALSHKGFVSESEDDAFGELQRLKEYIPLVDRVGDQIAGTIVGAHVNYKAAKSPTIDSVVCFLDEGQRVNFVVVKTETVQPKSASDIKNLLQKSLSQLASSHPVGTKINVEVVNHNAKFGKFRINVLQKEGHLLEQIEEVLKEFV